MDKKYLRFIGCCPECGEDKFVPAQRWFGCASCGTICGPQDFIMKEEDEVQKEKT